MRPRLGSGLAILLLLAPALSLANGGPWRGPNALDDLFDARAERQALGFHEGIAIESERLEIVLLGRDKAEVRVDYVLRSLAKGRQRTSMGFPGRGFRLRAGSHPEIESLRVTVDGEQIPFHQQVAQGVLWALWPLDLGPGARPAVSVRYRVSLDGNAWGRPARQVAYVLSTGAHWRGPISSFCARVRAAEGGLDPLAAHVSPGGACRTGTEIRWDWRLREPVGEIVILWSARAPPGLVRAASLPECPP